MAAYFRTGGDQQPSSASRVAELDGHTYVILSNVTGLLAIYRHRNDGQLKRLKRWPVELSVASVVDDGADLLMQAVKLADRLIAKAGSADKADLTNLRKLIATAGFTLDSTDASAGEDLRAVWGLA
ncbi:hypothetical protein [Variovorax sp. LT1R20]|uniref:hypothetical protein n=1 Tax=Variovorax sp. LT1R20 TaxID=3443729 RepID=UPI003F495E3D